jgi:hypothetical protein
LYLSGVPSGRRGYQGEADVEWEIVDNDVEMVTPEELALWELVEGEELVSPEELAMWQVLDLAAVEREIAELETFQAGLRDLGSRIETALTNTSPLALTNDDEEWELLDPPQDDISGAPASAINGAPALPTDGIETGDVDMDPWFGVRVESEQEEGEEEEDGWVLVAAEVGDVLAEFLENPWA